MRISLLDASMQLDRNHWSAKQFAREILDMLLMVLVQDSLELAPIYPENRVHALLLADVEFQELLVIYEERKARDVSHSTRQSELPVMTNPFESKGIVKGSEHCIGLQRTSS